MKEGWEYRKLDEICDFRSGFAFKSNKFTKIGEPIIRISDIQNEEVDDSNLVYFDPKSYTEDLSKYLVYPDDILIAMSGGTTGKLGINKSKRLYYLNQRVGVFRENKKYLNHRYLFYYLHTKSEESLRIAAGAAQPNLSTVQIKSFIIPVPPLSEQQSIVDYLDSAFAKIDAMKANAEKALNEAKALFQASLKEMLEPKEGWEEKKLGEICTFSQGVQVPLQNQSLKESAGYTRFLRIIDFTQGSEPPRYVPINDAKYWMNHEDIAIVRYGASTGFICTGLEGTLANNLFRLNIKCDVSPHYLIYVLKSEIFQSVIKVQMNGAAMPAISFGLIEGIKMPIPPLSEQQSIVETLDSLKSKVDRLQANFEKISQECDALKQAILRQVFE